MKTKELEGGAFVQFITTFDPVDASATNRFDPIGATNQRTFNEGFAPRLERGYDVDAILGCDFGFFRFEGELGYKKANRQGFDANDDLIHYVNMALSRTTASSQRPLPPLTRDDFANFDGKITFRTTMINVLVDLGNENGLSLYAGGGGGGRAWTAALNDKDKAFAYQLIAGARYAISRHIDFGLKYRHFRTGELNFKGGPVGVAGNDRMIPGRRRDDFAFVPITLSRRAEIFPEFGGKYKSHSLLASLTYNFGRL